MTLLQRLAAHTHLIETVEGVQIVEPLKLVERRIEHFSDNEKDVIRIRHFGSEEAPFALLARIILTTPQTIQAICRKEAA